MVRLCFAFFGLMLVACQTEVVPTPAFTVGFALPEQAKNLTVFPSRHALQITNQSTDAQTYRWDFGDGKTSTDPAPSFSYDKPGTYQITLTTISSTGEERSISQPITIVARKLESVTVRMLQNWYPADGGPEWPDTKAADVQFEIGRSAPTDPAANPSTILLRSGVVKNVKPGATPFTLPITETISLEEFYGPNGRTMIVFNLFAIDGAERRLIMSSRASGSSTSGLDVAGVNRGGLRANWGGSWVDMTYRYE